MMKSHLSLIHRLPRLVFLGDPTAAALYIEDWLEELLFSGSAAPSIPWFQQCWSPAMK
jgi:hypothetical protein